MDIVTGTNNNPSPTVVQTPQPYAILGSGGFAKEVFYTIFDLYKNFFTTAQNYVYLPSYFVFVDDSQNAPTQIDTGKAICRVVKNWAFDREYQFVVGTEDPAEKLRLSQKAIQKGLTPAVTVVHPNAFVQNAQIGVGGVIFPGVTITTDVIIGNYVTIGANTSIRYGSNFGDYASLLNGQAFQPNSSWTYQP